MDDEEEEEDVGIVEAECELWPADWSHFTIASGSDMATTSGAAECERGWWLCSLRRVAAKAEAFSRP